MVLIEAVLHGPPHAASDFSPETNNTPKLWVDSLNRTERWSIEKFSQYIRAMDYLEKCRELEKLTEQAAALTDLTEAEADLIKYAADDDKTAEAIDAKIHALKKLSRGNRGRTPWTR